MGKIRHSASAENDLLEAWLYIAEDSIDAADRLLDRIDAETRAADAAENGPDARRTGDRPAQLADVRSLTWNPLNTVSPE